MIDRPRLSALKSFERLIHYRFRSRDLLNQALTHRSYAYEHPRGRICDNERLEFLGDAILGLAISDYIYRHFPEYQEGHMTRIKSLLVSRMTLEELARRIGIGDLLILGKGEAANGGAEQPTNLVGAYEAVLGAIYLDGGFKRVNKFIEAQFKGQIKSVSENGITKDYKSILQEHTSKTYKSTPVYRVILEEGPDHKKHFEVNVSFGGAVRGKGEGKNKKSAEANAAYEALLNYGLLDNSNHKT
jgi:ribonuclease-3